MDRLLPTARLALPLLLAAAAAAIRLRAGEAGFLLALVALAGALLGWAIALGLESVALLLGQRPLAPLLARDPPTLEREKEQLLRSIKEVELDAALQQLDPAELARLEAPLRERALELLRELDLARVDRPASVADQIEAEIARRLDPSGEAVSR